MTRWWDHHPQFLENSITYGLGQMMEKYAVDHGQCAYTCSVTDRAPFENIDQLLASIEGFGMVICEVNVHQTHLNQPLTLVAVSGDSFVRFSNGSERAVVNLGSFDRQKLSDMVVAVKKKLPVATKGGDRTINYISASPGGGIGVSRIGKQTQAFVRENYRDEVLKDYDHVVSCLSSNCPCGRLSIFDGPPGTGKTHILRGLVHEVTDATFVIVPVDVISLVVAPGSVNNLINIRANKSGPLVLLVEDADHALAPRGADNISLLSSILNLGDGLLGELMDIRIVCTTNAATRDMDPAISRPGRTCRHTAVGPLGQEKSVEVFRRIVGEKVEVPPLSNKSTLADVYMKARESGWVPPKTSSTRIFDEDDEGYANY